MPCYRPTQKSCCRSIDGFDITLTLHDSPPLGIGPEQVAALLFGLVRRQVALVEHVPKHLGRFLVSIKVSHFVPTTSCGIFLDKASFGGTFPNFRDNGADNKCFVRSCRGCRIILCASWHQLAKTLISLSWFKDLKKWWSPRGGKYRWVSFCLSLGTEFEH